MNLSVNVKWEQWRRIKELGFKEPRAMSSWAFTDFPTKQLSKYQCVQIFLGCKYKKNIKIKFKQSHVLNHKVDFFFYHLLVIIKYIKKNNNNKNLYIIQITYKVIFKIDFVSINKTIKYISFIFNLQDICYYLLLPNLIVQLLEVYFFQKMCTKMYQRIYCSITKKKVTYSY